MTKIIIAIIATLFAITAAHACEQPEPATQQCITCPAGPQGEPGVAGSNGVDGKDGVEGINGANGRDGATIYRDSNADAGIAGAMAMARIGHARLGGEVVGLGIANFDGENAVALGLEKSWKTNTRSFNEVSVGVAGFVAGDAGGVAGSVNLHF